MVRMNSRILAIIPARGGSKGIPRKNLRVIAGKPLLAYSIEQAKSIPAITRVIVSTDDIEIAQSAQLYGAEVIMRPAEISHDTASSESALLHVLNSLREHEHYEPDLVVFLQATSPLREPHDIQRAIDIFLADGADSLLSVSPMNGFLWRNTGTEFSSFSYDFKTRPRRQDAPEDLVENGSIYIFKPWVLHELNNRLGGKIVFYRMSNLDYFQIDEPDDLELLEQLIFARHRKRQTTISKSAFARIRLLVLDFDGVLTDNRVLVNQDGKEAVHCSRADGWGIARLKDIGITVIVLSTETNPIVSARCKKLGIGCIQSLPNKVIALREIMGNYKRTAEEVAYVGNDVNDLECMGEVGLAIAVADAVPEILHTADWVTTRRGGEGAIREIADAIIASQIEGAK
jgi:YrbI family 3-deoxy-D-manno-octulosonate 8-phosphate phosphatase